MQFLVLLQKLHMEWVSLSTLINICWILLSMILSTYFFIKNYLILATIYAALAVVEFISLIQETTPATQAVVSVICVELYNRTAFSLKPCVVLICQNVRQTIKEYIIGTSAFLNYYSLKAKSRLIICYKLLTSCVTARTHLSTKALSEKYSDL